MGDFFAKRIKFQNGERLSVLTRRGGLPVHEAVLFVNQYRTKGKKANTIHQVCSALALLHRELAAMRSDAEQQGIDPVMRFESGRFLSVPELSRLADAAQFHVADLEDDTSPARARVVNLENVRMRLTNKAPVRVAVDVAYRANRIRYFAAYLRFVSEYVEARLSGDRAIQLAAETKLGLKSLLAHVPRVPKRAKLGARTGLSEEDQNRVLAAVHPNSPTNPWKHPFVRVRNWLIVVILLATGMRKGELLGLQIGDLRTREPKLLIVRRADADTDARTNQPVAKTNDREIELAAPIMRRLWTFINEDRRVIKRARRIPQVIVSDEGDALSISSIDKLFRELRAACPGLPGSLTSHVMRHTWNERFSEQADAMGLSSVVEEKARANQQGWVEGSKMGANYTRRHTERKGRAVALRIQEKLEEGLDDPE